MAGLDSIARHRLPAPAVQTNVSQTDGYRNEIRSQSPVGERFARLPNCVKFRHTHNNTIYLKELVFLKDASDQE